jgi:hypothetical protein
MGVQPGSMVNPTTKAGEAAHRLEDIMAAHRREDITAVHHREEWAIIHNNPMDINNPSDINSPAGIIRHQQLGSLPGSWG